MITVNDLPGKAIDAARIAMAEALARDGDGIPECIAAALNAWPGMRVDDTFRWLSDVAIILPMEDKNAES